MEKLQHNSITKFINDIKLRDGVTAKEEGYNLNWLKYETVCCRICGRCVKLVNYIQHQNKSKKHAIHLDKLVSLSSV